MAGSLLEDDLVEAVDLVRVRVRVGVGVGLGLGLGLRLRLRLRLVVPVRVGEAVDLGGGADAQRGALVDARDLDVEHRAARDTWLGFGLELGSG